MRGLIFLDFRVLGQRMKIGVRYEKFGELQKQERFSVNSGYRCSSCYS